MPSLQPAIPPTLLAENYRRDGFVGGVSVLSVADAARHRTRFERAEAAYGGPLHYVSKVHTILTSPLELATTPAVLDAVEALIGPDILLLDVTYIVKEPHSPSFVSWHQDLTYWGLAGGDQVSMWLALSPATEESGCMRMVPGSHRAGKQAHTDRHDPNNVLARGQEVTDVGEENAVLVPLLPGQASFHHGWTLHASLPNRSDDRRIGLNAQFITPEARQTVSQTETAMLVRGEDRFQSFRPERPAVEDLAEDSLQRHRRLDAEMKETWQKA
ncbi:phytanoyl-CoA dioxygenase family protein [Hwanghaeella grinnelliae]|uniref:Phytanoyl-CoA dioxygenase family protein n=1 Tax=Hwanghaeella grinnelliae TaxID=2500179 RepID=A0A3S2VM88_9PROT|nr:phytanoyl-CoA dioxygenase family protein [Hwanghaeella grinnelliae]RVU33804.1 phytanoyl-CoA dioxygenase family protein [Hwanghaeella grinnelliae]